MPNNFGGDQFDPEYLVVPHKTSLHGDGGKPELFQARCSCTWESGYMPELSAKEKAQYHRSDMKKGKSV